jgi:hypothetical protein
MIVYVCPVRPNVAEYPQPKAGKQVCIYIYMCVCVAMALSRLNELEVRLPILGNTCQIGKPSFLQSFDFHVYLSGPRALFTENSRTYLDRVNLSKLFPTYRQNG